MDARSRNILFLLLFPLLFFSSADHALADRYATARRNMVLEIEQDVRDTRRHIGRESLMQGVMVAMATVPRHEFVPAASRRLAYANRPLPIGHGQTISQPYIVALMTDLLQVDKNDRVLEIGAGSGYQAAILAELAGAVYTMEIIRPLGEKAGKKLYKLGYNNISLRIADGYYGWPEAAPFDAIIVTAAATHIPPPLLRQLKPGGRMVIPVGTRFMVQQLLLVEKNTAGEITSRQILPVRFVPFTGGH